MINLSKLKMDTKQVIENSKHFTLMENWGDPEKVSPYLVYALDAFRAMLGYKVHISPLPGAVYAESGHSEQSWHYIISWRNEYSMAADIFPECEIWSAWFLAMRMKCWGGIGIYPHAIYPDKLCKGMLHLDIRSKEGIGDSKILWYVDRSKRYMYIKSMDNLIYLMRDKP